MQPALLPPQQPRNEMPSKEWVCCQLQLDQQTVQGTVCSTMQLLAFMQLSGRGLHCQHSRVLHAEMLQNASSTQPQQRGCLGNNSGHHASTAGVG
jgi:hypothetical protein